MILSWSLMRASLQYRYSPHPSRPRKDQAAQTVMTLPHEEYKKVLSAIPIVCVDCLVVNENEEYLLVKRANPPLKGEYWVPGGRLYKNERILDAVHRKMREEVGIGVDVVTILGILEFFDPASEYSECGVHTISIVHLVKPLSYDIKLDDQATDWVGSKSCRKN